MTRNQLEYMSIQERERNNYRIWQENVRSNMARERENTRSNLENERLTSLSQIETERSNRERERLNRDVAAETSRSNRAREFETMRSNLANEQAKLLSLGLQTQQVMEQARSNMANESIARRNSSTAQYNAVTSRKSLEESIRSNKAQEGLASVRNREATRSNMAKEYLSLLNYGLSREVQTESNRLRSEELAERNRSNLVNEAQNLYHNLEYTRSNKANESIKGVDTLSKLIGTVADVFQ